MAGVVGTKPSGEYQKLREVYAYQTTVVEDSAADKLWVKVISPDTNNASWKDRIFRVVRSEADGAGKLRYIINLKEERQG